MPSIADRLRMLFDPDYAEKVAEDENVKRAPEGTRDRLRAVLDQGRRTYDEAQRLKRAGENQSRMHREGTKASDIG